MKIFKNYKKVVYVLSCFVIASFLSGCKEVNTSVFDGLPESTFLTEAKTSLENHIPLAVAFTAEWCPHCRKYKPVFNEVKDLYHDKVTFINIDVDDTNGSPISNRFQVRGIPTTAFVRADGSVLKVQVGEISKEELVKISDELLSNKKRGKGEPVAPFPLDLGKEETKPQEESGKSEPAAEPKKEKQEEVKPEEEIPSDTHAGEELEEDIPIPENENLGLPPSGETGETNDTLVAPESKGGETDALDSDENSEVPVENESTPDLENKN